jgi:hypothetical protein
MVSPLAKKNPLPPFGAGNGFGFRFVGVRLDHYRPLALIAEKQLGNEENNKADNGDEILHKLSWSVLLVWRIAARCGQSQAN